MQKIEIYENVYQEIEKRNFAMNKVQTIMSDGTAVTFYNFIYHLKNKNKHNF